MDGPAPAPGIAAGRLDPARLAENFSDLQPALSRHEALVAADRCYFCYDAPCVQACPTAIDIPLFIRQIAADQPRAAARTIFDQNILGGMCARVCPTETLCEEACVREAAEGEPVQIGRLQRYATDAEMATGRHPYRRAEPTGKRIAVVGAGPAGLACAHRLAMLGHEVTLYDARPKPGGLNEYGIAAYKTVDDFAAREAMWIMGIGGITLETGRRLGHDLDLEALRGEFDAVFLGLGLAGINALRVEGGEGTDAVAFIAELRQAEDLTALPVGRDVVVIGGGMTAIDVAVQSKLLGAETVTVVYRRDRARMGASQWEQELAAAKGVAFRFNASPVRLIGDPLEAVELEYTEDGEQGLRGTGATFTLPADQVFRAIGQRLDGAPQGLDLEGGKIRVDGTGRTSLDGVWAGGDCALGGDDLTVTATAQGRDAAIAIHAHLTERTA